MTFTQLWVMCTSARGKTSLGHSGQRNEAVDGGRLQGKGVFIKDESRKWV